MKTTNKTRRAMLRKIFEQEDKLRARLVKLSLARKALGRAYWKEEGYRFLPECEDALRREVFKDEAT